jgi:hypothetical protein
MLLAVYFSSPSYFCYIKALCLLSLAVELHVDTVDGVPSYSEQFCWGKFCDVLKILLPC